MFHIHDYGRKGNKLFKWDDPPSRIVFFNGVPIESLWIQSVYVYHCISFGSFWDIPGFFGDDVKFVVWVQGGPLPVIHGLITPYK